jgi:hypothetical protein
MNSATREPGTDRAIAERSARALVEYWKNRGFQYVVAYVQHEDGNWFIKSNLCSNGYPPGRPLAVGFVEELG